MSDWKSAYSTYLFYAIAIVGAVLMGLQSLTAEGVAIPAWALPVVGALGVFLRSLPQDPKQ